MPDATRRATRVAALYDIHGNLPALDAALAESGDADLVVVGGDVVLGPMPCEALERLLDLGPRAVFVRGNCDRIVVDAFDGRPLDAVPAPARGPAAWVAAQLDRRHRDALAAFADVVTVDVAGLGAVLFCHATPRSDDEIFTAATPEERVRPMLAGVTARVVVCGHTHMPFDRVVGGVRVVNAGSVGMPFGEPGAYWLLLGPDVAHVRTDYDLAAAAATLGATAYPDAAAFAERHVLRPPSEEEMLRAFEGR